MDKLLLPPPLASDERFSILANIAAERFAQIDLTALLVYLVDIVDASALPSLAEQFHVGNDSNLLIVFYVQIMPDDFVMQLHRF